MVGRGRWPVPDLTKASEKLSTSSDTPTLRATSVCRGTTLKANATQGSPLAKATKPPLGCSQSPPREQNGPIGSTCAGLDINDARSCAARLSCFSGASGSRASFRVRLAGRVSRTSGPRQRSSRVSHSRRSGESKAHALPGTEARVPASPLARRRNRRARLFSQRGWARLLQLHPPMAGRVLLDQLLGAHATEPLLSGRQSCADNLRQ